MSIPLKYTPHISVSQARLALECPLKWRFRYLDKLPSTVSPAMIGGSALDKGVTEWWRTGLSTAAFAALNAHLKLENMSDMFDDVSSDLHAFLSHEEAHMAVKEVQRRVTREIEGVPTDGYIDYTLFNDTIVDLKRGGKMWDATWRANVERQIAGYAWAAEPEEWTQGRIVAVKNGKVQVHNFDITPELKQEAVDELTRGMQAGPLNAMHPATPGMFCGWCNYQSACHNHLYKLEWKS